MFLRLVVVFFFTVYLASCETEKKSQGPPLLEALNAKYFGHIRGRRTVSEFNKYKHSCDLYDAKSALSNYDLA